MTDQGLFFALATEACIVLVLIVFIIKNDRKKSRDRRIVSKVISSIKNNKPARKDGLKDVLKLSDMDQGELDGLLDEIHESESRLYQHVVKIFLQKEVEHLKALDQHVSSLSDPYWKILKQLCNTKAGASIDKEEIEQLKAGLQVSLQEKERLSYQLGVALKTLDEVSGEYSKMFDGGAGLDELNESKERMIEFFEQALTNGNEDEDSDDSFDPLLRMESI